jgi:tetratricopeptide (TPR) repeat protein
VKGWVTGALVLLAAVFLAYGNTFDATWHLDDGLHILDNPAIQVEKLDAESLREVIRPTRNFTGSKDVFRPLPAITFALNWSVGRRDPAGYHLVNVTLHFLTAFFLFLAIRAVYRTPRLSNATAYQKRWVPLLGALLWSVSPVHTQAVTYIVQRMTVMAAMFTVIGILFYLRGRSASSRLGSLSSFVLCAAAFLCAVASKENAVTLPLLLLIMELAFFPDTLGGLRRSLSRRPPVTAIVVPLAAAGVFAAANLTILPSISGRETAVTPLESLLTTPAALIFYVSLLLFPVTSRLSIEHDFPVAASLFDPWTTLPATLCVLLIAAAALAGIKRRPLIAFSILFFILNHLIEASTLTIELIGEHRNYLPSLFLFAPLAALALNALKRLDTQVPVRILAGLSLLLIPASMVAGTYSRNLVWKTEKSLWEDAMVKAPARARPPQILATAHYMPEGDYDRALALLKKSLSLRAVIPEYSESRAYMNMGKAYLMKKEYQHAVEATRKALTLFPPDGDGYYQMALALAGAGEVRQASALAEKLTRERGRTTPDPRLVRLLAFILIRKGRPAEALEKLEPLLPTNSDGHALLLAGRALSRTGRFSQAEEMLGRAAEIYIYPFDVLLARAENRLRAGDADGAVALAAEMSRTVGKDNIIDAIDEVFQDALSIAPSRELYNLFKAEIPVTFSR